jgi:hypothetical protein
MMGSGRGWYGIADVVLMIVVGILGFIQLHDAHYVLATVAFAVAYLLCR